MEGLMLDALSTLTARQHLPNGAMDERAFRTVLSELADVSARITEADTDYDEGRIDRSRWIGRTDRLSTMRRKLEAQQRSLLARAETIDLPTGEPYNWWADLDAESRRRVARLLFQEVRVDPADNLGGRPDWNRIQIRWAG